MQRAQLHRVLGQFARGLPAGAVVLGVRGSDRSLLLRQAVQLARKEQLLVLEIDPRPHTTGGPPALLAQLSAAMSDQATGMPADLPGAVDLLTKGAAYDAAAPWVLLEAVAGALAKRAETRPLLVVIDDAQFLDEGSASLVPLLARRLATRRVAVLLGGSPTIERTPGWQAAVDALLTLPGLVRIELAPDGAAAPVDRRQRRAADEQDRVVRQVRAMGPTAAQLAALLAAVPGVTLAVVATVAAVVGLPPDPVDDALDALIAAGVLRLDERGRLQHVLPAVATVLADALPPAVRQQAHTAAAGALMARRSAGQEVALPELAGHLVHRTGPLDGAVDALREAAVEVETDDPATAASWWSSALGALPVGDPARLELLGRLVGPLRRLDRWSQIVDATQEVLDEQVPDAASPAQLELLCQLVDALVRLDRGEHALAMLERARRDGVSDPRVLAWHGRVLFLLERFQDAAEILWQVVEDPGSMAVVRRSGAFGLLVCAALSRTGTDVAADLVRLGDHVPELCVEPELFAEVRGAVAFGDFLSAERLLRRADVSMAPASNQLEALSTVRGAFMSGDWDVVLSEGEAALLLAGTAGSTNAGHALRAICAEVRLHRADGGAAERLLRGARTDAMCGHLVAGAQAQWHLSCGEVEAARSVLHGSLRRCHELGYRSGIGRLLVALVALETAAGRASAAVALLPQLTQVALAIGTEQEHFHCLYASALARSDPDAATAALAVLDQGGERPFDRARAQLLAGRLGQDSEQSLLAAYHAFLDLGATTWRRSTAAALRVAGLPVPRRRTASASSEALERRLVELVVAGRTNRQVATELQVSLKTVESHLTRIYARTGCRSRVELAARTARS